MSSELLVSAVVVLTASTFLASVYARSPFFSFFALLLWVIVFYPSYFADELLYGDRLANLIFSTASVALATVTALLLNKLMAQGQLINVFLTGSGGGISAHYEEKNVPWILFATTSLFFTIFFFVAFDTETAFMASLVTVSTTAARVMAIALTILTAGLLVASGMSKQQYGSRFHHLPDQLSALYYVGLTLAIVLPAIPMMWLSLTTAEFRGLIAMLVAIVVDAVVFGLGYWYEKSAYMNTVWHGRVWRPDESGLATAIALTVIVVLHSLLFLFGGFIILAVGNSVQTMFGFPYLALAFVIAISLIVVVYAVIALCFGYIYATPRKKQEKEQSPVEAKARKTDGAPLRQRSTTQMTVDDFRV